MSVNNNSTYIADIYDHNYIVEFYTGDYIPPYTGGTISNVTASNGLHRIENDIQLGGELLNDFTYIYGKQNQRGSSLIFGYSGLTSITGDTNNAISLPLRAVGYNFAGTGSTDHIAKIGSAGFGYSGNIIDNFAYIESGVTSGPMKGSSFYLTINGVGIQTVNPENVDNISDRQAYINLNPNILQFGLSNYNTGTDIYKEISVILDDNALNYVEDYSEYFNARSIPDVAFVTGLTSSGGVTANNGLRKTGTNIRLGGALTGNTSITGAYNLELGTTSSPLNTFSASAKSGFNQILLDNTNAQFGVSSNNNLYIDGINNGPLLRANSNVYLSLYPSSAAHLQFSSTRSLRMASAGITLTVGSDATGDMWYRNSSGFFTRLPAGSQNTLLGMGASSVPQYFTINNGLSSSSGTIRLGGTLTGNTTITTATGSRLNFAGYPVQYSSDQAANYNIRSLVDKGYVTGITSTLQSSTGVTTIVTLTGATTLNTSHAGKTIEANGTFTITLPNSMSNGYKIDVINVGSGTITFAATTTLNTKSGNNKLASQYSAASFYHRSSNVWRGFGDLTA